MIKNLPTKTYESYLFDESQELGTHSINPKLLVIYKTCSSKKMKRLVAVEPLTREFKGKYKATLLGLSKATVVPKQIIDSSLFVPNELCVTLQGYPITSETMDQKISGQVIFEDKRNHIH